MSYKVKTVPKFEKELKRLAKRYSSIKDEFIALTNSLKKTPVQGIPLGNNCYKIRLAISSKGKGKSGGARIITYIHVLETFIFLLPIFDKSTQENISENELKELLKSIS